MARGLAAKPLKVPAHVGVDEKAAGKGQDYIAVVIQAIRVSARGYRNREHFKTAIYFHLSGLQLYPAAP
ncbi:MAG: hypothetical protein WBO08_06000 [Mycobacterium sp.]